jgi:pilus assembly protein CpaC
MNILQKAVSCLTAALIVLCFAVLSYAERAAIPVYVAVDKSTLLTIKEPSKRVSISNPKIAELNLISPTEVLVNGKKIGITSLIVWDAQGKTSFFDVIVTGDISQLQEQIKEVAPHDDIRAVLAGDAIVLSGHAKNQQVIDKVVRLAQAYAVASEVKTTTTYSGGVAKESTESSGKVINHIIIEEAQQVLLEVRVAQLDKTKLKELGISTLIKGKSGEGFTNLVGAPSGAVDTDNFIGPGITTHAEGIAGNVPGLSAITPLDPFQIGVSYFPGGVGAVLKALTSKGLAKVLAEPNLTVRSGEKGNFHVGTKYPIQTVTGTGGNATVSIYYEEIGIRLNFAPTVLETGAIRLKIDPAEVSSITDFVRLENLVAPIIDARTVTTSVDLKDGESLILAGLLSEDMKKNISKIPILGDVPILGALFRNTRDELTQRELVFFITPKLVTAMSPGTKPELPGEKPLTPEQEREFQWMPLSLNGAGK